jgi:hypothetical protein
MNESKPFDDASLIHKLLSKLESSRRSTISQGGICRGQSGNRSGHLEIGTGGQFTAGANKVRSFLRGTEVNREQSQFAWLSDGRSLHLTWINTRG